MHRQKKLIKGEKKRDTNDRKVDKKQAQEGNSRVRLEMTNKRAKTCLNVKNVKKC